MADIEFEREADAAETSVRAWPLIIFGLLLMAAIVAAAWQYRGQYPVYDEESTTVSVTAAPPPVDPVVYKAVSEETAQKVNAGTPFTTRPIPPAKPFAFQGGSLDRARAVDCMASAIYYEAGAETLDGQKAVAQVILNRVRHPAYPRTVCGVIFQGAERRTGCQFSYTCDGSIVRRKPAAASWERLRGIARQMIGGEVYKPVGYATHYHTNWVLPVWSSKLDKVRQEGTHLFFRWTGFWGTPAAFRGGGGAGEAAQARMVALSPYHRTAETLAEAEALAKVMAELGTVEGAATGNTVFVDATGNEMILALNPGTDASLLPGLAEATCGARENCMILAWVKGAPMPKMLPANDVQFSAMAFSYLRNRGNGFEKALWNCALFPREDKRQCIRKRVIIEGKATELIPMTVDAPLPAKAEVALDKNGLRPINPDDPAGTVKAPPVSRTAGRRIPGKGD